MDPVTHGITGALLGKGYFSERYGRVATFAAVVGAVFPDVDIIAEMLSRDPLAIVRYHRAITHSFVGLPFFALLLAWLIRWLARRRGIESPPFGILALICGIGIASHILLDGMTSFGTRMWFPISSRRVAWDLLFIIDFTFTAIILLPQVLAWIYAEAGGGGRVSATARARANRMWTLFTACTLAVWELARFTGYPFHIQVAALIILVLAVLFYAPGIGGWGFRVTRAGWCQAGVLAMVAYLFACAVAHHSALLRVKAFADQQGLAVNRMGALPIPPSFLDWAGKIRTDRGVYDADFDLRSVAPPGFAFVPDSQPDAFVARAFSLPEVLLFWQFSRFPSIRSFDVDGLHVVDLGEARVPDSQRRGPQPFTFRVVFDAHGNVVQTGWLGGGASRFHMRQAPPEEPGGKNP